MDIANKERALALWRALETGLLNLECTLEKIIEERAWVSLGYESFHEAYSARLSHITLAAELRPHVVYQMFSEGLGIDAVAGVVKGVGRDRATSLHRQRSNGVPPGVATMHDRHVVREHVRKDPGAAASIHVRIGARRMERYQRIAKKIGLSVEEIAFDAIDTKFSELDGCDAKSA